MPGEDQFRRPGQGGARLIARDDLLARLGRAAEGKDAIISAPAEIRATERRSAPTHGVARKLKTTTRDNRGKENYACPRQRGYSRRNG